MIDEKTKGLVVREGDICTSDVRSQKIHKTPRLTLAS